MSTQGQNPFDIQRYLIKNERIVWTATPVRKFFLRYVLSQDPSRLMGYYFFFFGLFFALMPLLLFSFAPPPPSRKGEPPIILFSIFGLCFAAIGYGLSFGRRRRAIKQFERTVYYLTNHRALIVSGAERPTLTASELRRVPQISISLVDGTVGNIVFGDADPAIHKGLWRIFDPWGWWGRWDKRRLEGFIAILDAEDIMRRIAQIEDELP
jgi:hypothetical protein